MTIVFSYHRLHQIMNKKVVKQKCIDCGSSKNLVLSCNNRKYSENIKDYSVRCCSCNLKKDLAFKKDTGCSPVSFFWEGSGTLYLKKNEQLPEVLV